MISIPIRLNLSEISREIQLTSVTGFFHLISVKLILKETHLSMIHCKNMPMKTIFRTNPFTERREEFFDLKGINKSGNITRGISFGNQQNVFVNSPRLIYSLDGQLTEDIAILASISDQNVPLSARR